MAFSMPKITDGTEPGGNTTKLTAWAPCVIHAGEESAAIRPTGAPMGASGDAAIRRVMSAPHSAHLLSSVSRTAPANTPGTVMKWRLPESWPP